MPGIRVLAIQICRHGSFRTASGRQFILRSAARASHHHTFLLERSILPNKRKIPFSCTALRFFATVPPTPTNDNNKDKKDDDDEQHSSTSATTKRELMNNFLQQLKSPPNLITLSRILSTPILSYFIISQHYDWALYGCFAAGVSDVLDGFIAKRYNMSTVLGTYLDPLADKILINVLSVSLWYSDILPTPLILLWLGRDVVLMGATYFMVSNKTKSDQFVVDPLSTPLKVEPTNISKLNTAFQFLTLGVGLLQPVYNVPPGILETLW